MSFKSNLIPISESLNAVINSLANGDQKIVDADIVSITDFLKYGRDKAVSALFLAECMGIDGTERSKIRAVRNLISDARMRVPICCDSSGYWLPETDRDGVLTEDGLSDVLKHYWKTIRASSCLFKTSKAEHEAIKQYEKKHSLQTTLFDGAYEGAEI